jgi:hypothetical protein
MGGNVGFTAGAFRESSAADVADNFSAGAAENDLFVFAVVAFHAQESAFGLVRIIHDDRLTPQIQISLL